MSRPHDELHALAAGFVLGALEPDDRRMFEAHLNECPDCAAEVRSLVSAVDALGGSVPARTPPAGLRQRVLASIRGARPQVDQVAANPWTDRRVWLPAAALLLTALGAGIYGSHLHVESRLAALSLRAEANDRDIAAAHRAARDARRALEVIAAPDVVRIDLEGQGTAASATARALWSRQHGVVFAGSRIPTPPPGMCYQVWLVTARRAVSVGILPESGDGVAVFDTPLDIPQPLAAVVTLEPAGGAPGPTGVQVLAGNPPGSF